MDFKHLFDLAKDLGGPADVTGRALAQNTGVLAGGLEGEKMIEGCHCIYPAQGDFQPAGDISHQVGIEIAERFLNGMQRFDQRVGRISVQAHGSVDDSKALVRGSGGEGR